MLRPTTSIRASVSERASTVLGAAILLLCLAVSIAPPASAQADGTDAPRDPEAARAELIEQGLVQLDSLDSGALLLETDEPGWYVTAPTLRTNFDVSISGPIARTVVSQSFRNVADVFVEGKYLFPLPEGAAVDTLRMRVGDRWIQGEIEEREQAREIYEEAREAGQVASLVEQLRPNAFTTSVANIEPGALVIVQIEYQESLAPVDGAFGMRLPLVVAPRYTPSYERSPAAELTATGWSLLPVVSPDGSQDPSPTTPSGSATSNPVTISVDLQAGFPVGDVTSPFHDIAIDPLTPTSTAIELTGPVRADRDFYLSWSPRELDEPYAEAFTESRNDETHLITMLTPPSASSTDVADQAREIIFVQDTSGSMQGSSIQQARKGLVQALSQLTPADEFNIIEFNSDYSTFAPEPVKANSRNINRATRWVDGLVAEMGTEMLPALEQALSDSDPNDGKLRQVIFLTDGSVTNESQLFELIDRRLGKSRLFTVGIGSAPNSYFMTAAAQAGRGTGVFIGDVNEVQEKMDALFAKIDAPAVVDLEIDGLPEGSEISPYPIPDVYAGDPVVLTVRMPAGTSANTALLTGNRAGQPWQLELALADAESRPGVSKLWAREYIAELEAQRYSVTFDTLETETIDERILATALDFGLVSRLTSLVAVDVEVTRPNDSQAESVDLPLALPEGWDVDAFTTDSELTGDTAMSDEALERLTAVEETRIAELDGAPRETLAYTGANSLVLLFAAVALITGGAGTLRCSKRARANRS